MQPLAQAPNEHWSMDFMTATLYDGRRFRVLTLGDNLTRESPAIEVDFSLPSKRVVAVLDRLAQTHGLPKVIDVDNGPECVAKALDDWAHRSGVKLAFSRPGTPTDTPFSEAFNGRFRQECLDQHWFASIEDARMTIEGWRVDYNTVRPHTTLENQAPELYKANWLRAQQQAKTG
jgi:putative transposase